jgi:hypothetical protein
MMHAENDARCSIIENDACCSIETSFNKCNIAIICFKIIFKKVFDYLCLEWKIEW